MAESGTQATSWVPDPYRNPLRLFEFKLFLLYHIFESKYDHDIERKSEQGCELFMIKNENLCYKYGNEDGPLKHPKGNYSRFTYFNDSPKHKNAREKGRR